MASGHITAVRLVYVKRNKTTSIAPQHRQADTRLDVVKVAETTL